MIFPIKKQPLYMPMLGTFGGGSARGFGRGAAAREWGVVQKSINGAPTGQTYDPSLYKTGDVLIIAYGALNAATSGNVWAHRCTSYWSPGYYEGGGCSVFITNTSIGAGSDYVHYRAPKSITSYSWSGLSYGDGGSKSLTSNLTGDGYSVRVASSGGYSGAVGGSAGGGGQNLKADCWNENSTILAINANAGSQTVTVGGGNFVRVSGSFTLLLYT